MNPPRDVQVQNTWLSTVFWATKRRRAALDKIKAARSKAKAMIADTLWWLTSSSWKSSDNSLKIRTQAASQAIVYKVQGANNKKWQTRRRVSKSKSLPSQTSLVCRAKKTKESRRREANQTHQKLMQRMLILWRTSKCHRSYLILDKQARAAKTSLIFLQALQRSGKSRLSRACLPSVTKRASSVVKSWDISDLATRARISMGSKSPLTSR